MDYAEPARMAATTEGIREAGGFDEPEQWRFDWERPYTRHQWLDGVPTAGGCDLLPSETVEELVNGIGDAIDAVGGTFTMGYAAVVVTAARTGFA